MCICQQNNCNGELLPEAESCKSEGNGKLANKTEYRSENLQRQIHGPVFCFALFLLRIKKTEMATMPIICGISDLLQEMKMIGCRNLRGLAMQLKATKFSVQHFGQMMEDKTLEAEHKAAKLEITSVKAGLYDRQLQSERNKKGDRVMMYFGWIRD